MSNSSAAKKKKVTYGMFNKGLDAYRAWQKLEPKTGVVEGWYTNTEFYIKIIPAK